MIKNILRTFYKIGINTKLSEIPSYSQALQHLFQNQFVEAEKQLNILKQDAQQLQDPLVMQEVLDLFKQLYTQNQNHKELLSTQEEIFFTYLSINSIFNEDNLESLKELFRLYINHDSKRGQALLGFLSDKVDDIIPLGYQKEYYIYAGTLEMLNKNYENAYKYLNLAQEQGAKEELLGMCLNNQVILSELNLEAEMKKNKGDFEAFFKQNIKNLLDAIITFELAIIKEESKKELAYLYKLIEQTEQNINTKEINAIINGTIISNPNSFQSIFNLIDLLINHHQTDKASAWIKVVFKNKTQQSQLQIKSFGRALLQYAKISVLDDKQSQAETILIDFLNSNKPRISFLQMMGLTQYSFLLKNENRNYEADQYEKQALNISSKIGVGSYIKEQIILL